MSCVAGRLAGALLVVMLGSACRDPSPDLTAEHMDVALSVLADGSVEVRERIAVHFGDTPSTTFRRHTPAWRHDGVFGVSAAMDAAAFAPGEGPGRLQVAKGEALDVRWTFPPVSRSTRVFILNYRVANAVEISGIRGTVSWRALPSNRDFDVQSFRATLTLPPGAVLLQDPWVEEAGWDVTRESSGLTAVRAGLSRAESATLGVEFTIDTMAAAQPTWQYRRTRARQFTPAFLSAGVFLLIVGAGVLGMMRMRFPQWRMTDPAGVVPPAPPAMHVAVVRGRCRGDAREILAALRGLAARGVVNADGDVTAASLIRRGKTAGDLTRHEQHLADEVWFRHNEGVAVRAILSRGRRRNFRRALLADLLDAGLANRERVSAVRDLRVAGIVILVFGVAAWWVVAVTLEHFGWAPLSVPAGVVAVALMFLVAARKFSILSATGEKASADWHKLSG